MYSFAEKLTDFRHVQLKEDNTEAFEFFLPLPDLSTLTG